MTRKEKRQAIALLLIFVVVLTADSLQTSWWWAAFAMVLLAAAAVLACKGQKKSLRNGHSNRLTAQKCTTNTYRFQYSGKERRCQDEKMS